MTAERYDHAGLVRGWLREPVELPPLDLARLDHHLDLTPQRRGWLPPLDTRRFQSMFSATKVVVAGLIVAMFGGFLSLGVIFDPADDHVPPAAVGESPSASPPVETAEPTPAGHVHVVAQDGSGDFTSIMAAVEAAVDGDTISLRPGIYDERVFIERDIALVGDGPTGEIIIQPSGDSEGLVIDEALEVAQPHGAVTATHADVRLSGLSMRAGEYEPDLLVVGGDLVLEGVDVPDLFVRTDGDVRLEDNVVDRAVIAAESASVIGNRGRIGVEAAGAIIRDNVGAIDWSGSSATITNNSGDLSVAGDGTVVEGNVGGSLRIGGRSARATGNRFESADIDGPGQSLRDNTFRNAFSGADRPTTAVRIGPDSTGTTVEGNLIEGEQVGLTIRGAANVVVADNEISGGEVALVTESEDVELRDNRMCGSAMDVMRGPGSELDLGSNELCNPVPERWKNEDGWVLDRLAPGIDVLVDDGFGLRPVEHYAPNGDSNIEGAIHAVSRGANGDMRVFRSFGDDEEDEWPGPGGTVFRHRVGKPGDPRVPFDGNDGKASGDAPRVVRENRRLWARAERALQPEGRGPSKIVEPLGVGSDGTLWALVRTPDGRMPARFDGKRWKAFPWVPGPTRAVIGDGAVDRQGRLWFGGDHGLIVFDGKTSHTILKGLRDTIEAAADGHGRIYSGILGLTIVDPSELDLETDAVDLQADRELAERFPARLSGQEIEVTTMTSHDWLTQIRAGRKDEAAKTVRGYTDAAAGTPEDLTMGFTVFSPTPGNFASLGAVRVRGADATTLSEAVIPLMMRTIEQPVVETVSMAGKQLGRVTDAAWDGKYPRWTYASGDTVWVIDADRPIVREIVAALP